MRQLKSRRFSRVLAEYLKKDLTDFHQTYFMLRQPSIAYFEIKRLEERLFIVAMVTNS